MNICNAINYAAFELKDNKIDSAQLDSEILMSKVLKKDRKYLIVNSKNELNDKQYLNFRKLILNRLKGKPVAYLTGSKSFWKYDFDLNSNVLIPRPDTELIIEQVLEIYKNKKRVNFLEVGTGSGCIILSVLKEKKSFFGTGADIRKECLQITKINAQKLKVNNRLKLIKSDVDNLILGKYDLIISNPPYIKFFKLSNLNREIKDFEPHVALNGGIDGLSEIRKTVKKSSELIKCRGKLILEIAHDQKNEVKKILKQNGFYINKIVKDLAKNDRCVVSTKI